MRKAKTKNQLENERNAANIAIDKYELIVRTLRSEITDLNYRCTLHEDTEQAYKKLVGQLNDTITGYKETAAASAIHINDLTELNTALERDRKGFEILVGQLRTEASSSQSDQADRELFRTFTERMFSIINEAVRKQQIINRSWILSELAVLFNKTKPWMK